MRAIGRNGPKNCERYARRMERHLAAKLRKPVCVSWPWFIGFCEDAISRWARLSSNRGDKNKALDSRHRRRTSELLGGSSVDPIEDIRTYSRIRMNYDSSMNNKRYIE